MNLANGIHVSFYNLSRKIAADRWLIKVKCDALLPLRDDFADSVEDTEFRIFVKDRCKNGLVFTVVKERTFIDESEKDDLLSEMLAQLEKNSLQYVGSELFPEKFLERKMEDFKNEFRVRQEMAKVKKNEEEDEEPVDFSACFKD